MSKLTDKLDAYLIADWRFALRYASIWIMAANGAVVAVWAAYPDLIREILPPVYVKILLAFLVLSSMFARVWKQRTPENQNVLSRCDPEPVQQGTDADADRLAADSGGRPTGS